MIKNNKAGSGPRGALAKTNLWRGLAAVFGLIFALMLVMTNLGWYYEGFVNTFFGIVPPVIEGGEGTQYYTSSYGELNAANSEKLIEAENDFNIRAMEEGAVMLRNENNALPLTSDEMSVTLFGNSVKNPVYATNGGGSTFKESRGGSLLSAFQSAGFDVNMTMFNAYLNSGVDRVSSSTPGASDIGEVGQDFYTAELTNSYANEYNDVAIVLFTRFGGEGVDLDSAADADGVPLLSFHQEEQDLLRMIERSGKFDKTVVLVNSPFPMDIEWIEDPQYGVDACLAFGAAGDVGFIGIANILTGKADPSGHLTDTYASDSLSAPAIRNFGDFTFSNHNTQYENKYVVYAENVYVGYKYYETRYHDQVLGINNASGSAGVYASSNNSWNYAEEMAYTFGYGLSYADFTQEVQSIEWDRENHEVVASVKVTNNGPAAGSAYTGSSKSVVQLYASLPYEAGQAEKSAIQMIGFAKTPALAVGEECTVEVRADDYLFATYDEDAANGADPSLLGCYVFDEGDYYFAVGDNAHDALNNVLAAKDGAAVEGKLTDEKGNVVAGDAAKVRQVTLDEYDNTTYARSEATGEIVSNQFDEIDYNYFVQDTVTYLTRSDWNTYPKSYTGLSVNDELKTLLVGETYAKPADSPSVDSITTGAENGIEFIEMKDVPYDDERWDDFIDQLSITELATIMGETMGNAVISSVNKPANSNQDGPKGLGSTYSRGNGEGITLYVDQVTMSSTWNLDLLAERGDFFAEDALYAGYSMIYGPGADWHRTPYSGRNSEYYSEDANMSYLCGAAQVKAMQEGGVIAAIKHFAANDQETNRHGVATFMNEQGFRQGSLRCFEGALRDDVGGGLGTMTCFNRVGATAGAASEALLKQVLRNEWGFKGVNLTDSSRDAADYVHTEECVVYGTDMFNNDNGRTNELVKLVRQGGDGTVLLGMKEANKHFYYAYAHSNLINGLAVGVEVPDFVPWWKPALIGLDIVFGVLLVGCLGVFAVGCVLKSRKGGK